MSSKSVEHVIAPGEPHRVGDGFHVYNFIPSRYHLDHRRMDPFLLLDYNAPYVFDPSSVPHGVGRHPHR